MFNRNLILTVSLGVILPVSALAQEPTGFQSLDRQCGVIEDGNGSVVSSYDWCFEGDGLFGEGDHHSKSWENPIDDDWRRAWFRQEVAITDQVDSNGTTYLSVNTIRHPTNDPATTDEALCADARQPAWFNLLDPTMTDASGFEARLRIRIPDTVRGNSPSYQESPDDAGFSLLSINADAHFAVFFDQDKIVFNPEGNSQYYDNPNAQTKEIGSGAGQLNIDLTNEFHEFVVRSNPAYASNSVEVYYVDPNDPQMLTDLFPNAQLTPTVTSPPVDRRAEITIGDYTRIPLIEGTTDCNFQAFGGELHRGVFDIDFFRVRNLHSDQMSSNPVEPRPTFPNHVVTQTQLVDVTPSPSPSHDQINLDGQSFPTLSYKDDFTAQLRMRFDSNAVVGEGYSFSLGLEGVEYQYVLRDGTIIPISANKPVASQSLSIPGFDPFDWNDYRLVHVGGNSYSFLYINDNPIPVIGLMKGSRRATGNRIRYGGYATEFGDNAVEFETSTLWADATTEFSNGFNTSFQAEVASIEYALSANAPYNSGRSVTAFVGTLDDNDIMEGEREIVARVVLQDNGSVDPGSTSTFNDIKLKYSDAATTDPKNCILYDVTGIFDPDVGDGLRLNASVVSPTHTGHWKFAFDNSVVLDAGESRTLQMTCLMPIGTVYDGSSFRWGISREYGRAFFTAIDSESSRLVLPFASSYDGRTVYIRP